MIEVEIQNETNQSQERVRFTVMPRMGEGIRLMEPNGFWASYDILDLWYQKSEFGDVWIPYIHVRKTPEAPPELEEAPQELLSPLVQKETVPFEI